MIGDDLPQEEPLSRETVESLEDGTRVIVMWSGGNGPHEYEIAVDADGERYASRPGEADERMRFYNPLEFVGTEHFHTRVWLGEAKP